MKSIQVILITIAFTLYNLGAVFSQSTNVEFRVNMNHQITNGNFFTDYETVDIAGTFNSWGTPEQIMHDEDNDGIYSIVVSLNIGETIEFKCRINGEWEGREEFPGGGPNRSYTVEEDGLFEFWYNDEIPSTVLDVRISSSTVFAEIGELIYFFDISSGNPIQWDWEFPGGSPSSSSIQNPVVSYSDEGDYSISLTITNSDNESLTKTFANYVRVGQKETAWWNDAVFYEVFVRSFKDSDGNGKGDIQGLIDKLDYLNDGDPETKTDLGITGIWLMPIQQSPSYHGYDVTDYRTVEQDYGNNADFIQLIEEAHARGIKIIIDLVINHTSSQHSWFVESSNATSTKRDWYVWSDTNPGFTGPWGQTVWHYRNGSYYYGLFWSGMPDLNFNTPEVKDEIFDIARFWLEDMNVDGFRLDAVKYLYEDGTSLENLPSTIQFWKDFRSFYKSVNPDAFSVGEAWAATEVVMPYVNDNALDYCFEFELAGSIMNSVINGNAGFLNQNVVEVLNSYPFLQFGTFLTNHDMDRVMSVFDGDVDKAKLAASLLLTLPGIPYIYYGEEIGMTGVKPDEFIRTPMQWTSGSNAGFTQGTPWISVNSDYTSKNVEYQQADPNSLWNLYRNLIEIRNNETSLRRGNYKPVNTNSSSVFAFLRQYNNENVLVISNLSSIPATEVNLEVLFSGVASGDYSLYNLLGDGSQSITIDGDGIYTISLNEIPGQTTRIFTLENPGTGFVTPNLQSATINLYPVPTKETLYVHFESDKLGKVVYEILDSTGRQFVESSFSHTNSNQNHSINIANFPKGIYIIKLRFNGAVVAKRFVVQ